MQQDELVSTVSGPSGDTRDGQAQLNPSESSQEANMDPWEHESLEDAGRPSLVNCKQKVGPKSLYELDEDGYYSSEPEAEETEPSSESEAEERDPEHDSDCEPSDSESHTPSDSVPTSGNIDQHIERIQFWLKDSAEDLRRLLPVLIAEPHEPHNFDAETLGSTLELAIKYHHSDLRDWAMQELDRLRNAKPPLPYDCGATELGPDAMEDMCTRDEPITEDEAFVLGYSLLLKIMAQRERNQYEKGRRAGMSQYPSRNSNGANATTSTAVSMTTPADEGLPAPPSLSLPSPQALRTELPQSP